jgi:hypothetical protein
MVKMSKIDMARAAANSLPKCSTPGCDQQPYMVPDFTAQPRVHKEPSKRNYRESDGMLTTGGDLTSTVSYPLKPHKSGKCYYCLKVAENYFHAKFPLPKSGRVYTMGKGGLSECPTSLNSVRRWQTRSRQEYYAPVV